MRYEAKNLINRTGKTVEFMCGGQLYIFKSGEKKVIDGFAAHHALKVTNTGLEEVTEDLEKELGKEEPMPDFASLPWKTLQKRGDFKPGMNKEALVAKLEEKWKTKHSSSTKAS